jgi:POT family proton-dependent oligopeptide transporter
MEKPAETKEGVTTSTGNGAGSITDKALDPGNGLPGPDLGGPDLAVQSGTLGRLLGGHPIGFWFFFWGEFAERCSYYGMRAILAKYMADKLSLGEANAATYMSYFIAACYFLPLVGGFVADKFFGKYWTIVGFSIPYIMGHLILGVESFWFMVGALCLLAMGSGVIKPNISTLMGLTYDQQRPGQTQLRSDAFAIFYFAINIGAAISQFAMPPIRTHFGYAVAFAFPAALMVVAFAIFAAGKRFYAKETTLLSSPKDIPNDAAKPKINVRQLMALFALFALVMFFWAIFDQSASTWIFFANSCMNLKMFGIEVDPDQVQAFNPVFILILLPVITLLFKWMNKDRVRVRATDKMVLGFVLTALCMGVMAFAAWLAGPAEMKDVAEGGKSITRWVVAPENQVTVWWQILAYLVITVAEVLISVTGLELAYTAAPKSMSGFVTACWLLTVGMANLFINAPVTRLYTVMQPMAYFAMLGGVLLAVSIAFIFVARMFNAVTAESTPAPNVDLSQAPRGDGRTGDGVQDRDRYQG